MNMDLRLYSSIFLVNEKEEVLLVREGKEKVHGLWNFPGGHVEEGEEFAKAAIRETKEETGLDVHPSHLLKIFCGEYMGSLHFVFYAMQFSGTIRISDANILEAAWIPVADIESMKYELLHPYKFLSILESHKKKDLSDINIIDHRR